MKLNKKQRIMLYQVAITIKKDQPEMSNHSCMEEAFLRCAGFASYDEPLESMLPEYNRNSEGNIESFLNTIQ